MSNDANDQILLLDWYRHNKRDLPWRHSPEAYGVWISEVMLQQTTVQAVIPYYERFMARFPTLESLAKSPVESVLEHWAGLGYYSRARNLHKAARELARDGGFPKTHLELSKYPGFGPYTARAVSSIAFGEHAGIVDGNVVRVLSRRHGLKLEWWTPKGRAVLQEHADRLVARGDSSSTNQALMDLGATVCVPRAPRCLLCPWASVCAARKLGRQEEFPLARPRKEREIWIWRPRVLLSRGRVGLVANEYAPFLKGHLICPGRAERKNKAPKKFDFRHSVTCHDIFVILERENKKIPEKSITWVPLQKLKQAAPSSLLQKALKRVKELQ
ncbi:MAG TPA: A/G-specific adenine glycosylase [Bdellovibrionales bacterium]|nr:A/G-specific adenine glycosylase [Bdellovibrionales bacterium]